MRRAVAALVVLVAAATAPAAAAQTAWMPSYRGATTQRLPITWQANGSGGVETIEVGWIARCSKRVSFPVQTTTFVPARTASKTAIDGVGRYRAAAPGGRIGAVDVRITGAPRGDPLTQPWAGVVTAKVVVRRHGRFERRCAVRTSWAAKPEQLGGGSWFMSGDAGDWVSGGRDWRFTTPPDTIAGRFFPAKEGAPEVVELRVRTADGSAWSASFQAPEGQPLRQGVRYEEPSGGPSFGPPDLRVGGDGRGCNASGSFVFEVLKLDGVGRLVEAKVSYAQICDNGPEGARGVIEWRSSV